MNKLQKEELNTLINMVCKVNGKDYFDSNPDQLIKIMQVAATYSVADSIPAGVDKPDFDEVVASIDEVGRGIFKIWEQM